MTTTSVYSLPTKQGQIRTLDMEKDLSFLRSQGPLVRVTFPFGGDGWVVTTYEESRALLADPRLSLAEAARGQYPHLRAGENRAEFYSFMQVDPPEHGSHRSVLGRHMTVKRVAELRVHAVEGVLRLFQVVERRRMHLDLAGAPRPVRWRVGGADDVRIDEKRIPVFTRCPSALLLRVRVLTHYW